MAAAPGQSKPPECFAPASLTASYATAEAIPCMREISDRGRRGIREDTP